MSNLTALNILPRILTVALLIIFYLIAALLVLALIALLIPLQYQFYAHIKPGTVAAVRLRYAFLSYKSGYAESVLSSEFRLFGKKLNLKPGTKKSSESKSLRKKSKASSRKRARPGRAVLKEAKRLICSVYLTTKPKVFSANGTYSLADPADTALLAMLIMSVAVALPKADICLQPDFVNEENNVLLRLTGRIVPIVLVFYVLRFMLKKEVRLVLIGRRIR